MKSGLNKELERILNAYCEEAPEEAKYPYKVFSASRIMDEDGKQVYDLEVNVWDQHPFYSRAESIMDELEGLHMQSFKTEGLFFRIFRGKRDNIPDPDKSIKRVFEQFELHVWERK